MTWHEQQLASFQPHRLVRGAHAQTIAGLYLPGPQYAYRAQQHHISLDDGDQIVLHEDPPTCEQDHQRIALLIHGMGGCYRSTYMMRIAGKLANQGVRVFRLDMRACGAGVNLSVGIGHAGRSEDAATALRFLAKRWPNVPVTAIGFSLGANVILKMLGEARSNPPGLLDSAIAVAPPIDLVTCARYISRPKAWIYERSFVRWLHQRVRSQDIPQWNAHRPPRSVRRLRAFDEHFTARISGFDSADDYYRQCSAGPLMREIQVPTWLIASADDPLIPIDIFRQFPFSRSVRLEVTQQGGHLGYIARDNTDADRRWLDWRVIDLVKSCDQLAMATC